MDHVLTGLENFLAAPPESIHGNRLGLLCNPASVNRRFQHASKLIDKKFPGQLTALFSPQHGFFAEKQDNMIESDHMTDPDLNIPIFSLYGQSRKPLKEMLNLIDILIIDLQDAGTRVYTFIYTMSYCQEAAQTFGKKVIILDRPNPVNGMTLEGNCLNEDCASFVGRFPIPMRHGLTIGELSLLFNDHFKINCDIEVVPMKNWKREMVFPDTGLPWVPPSPNLPTVDSAMVYPGQVLWEGTNISEGRGTTQPFELFGAPFLDTQKILEKLSGPQIPGAFLRAVVFEPTSNKWGKKPCHGFQIHVTDPQEYRPYISTLKLIQSIILLHQDDFKWKLPPYEYETQRMPIDLITGSRKLRKQIEQAEDIDAIASSWEKELEEYKKMIRPFLLY